jgi:hypothetical protein
MEKKYIVRLNDQERDQLELVIGKLSGSSQKVRRANFLLMADANGPGWTGPPPNSVPGVMRVRVG